MKLSVISCRLLVASYRLPVVGYVSKLIHPDNSKFIPKYRDQNSSRSIGIKILLPFYFLLFTFSSCISDKPEVQQPQTVNLAAGTGLYIANEGNFQFGNASVSYYNLADSTFSEDIFKTVNKRSLGDVCQSLCFFSNKLYIVVNNSGKVEIVDAKSFKSLGTISGLQSPRYILPVSNAKAYVTDLYSNSVSIVDLNSGTKTGSIACTGWTEQLLLSYGKAFITNSYRDKVYVVNTATDSLIDSIAVGYASNSIVEDKQGKIWVLCSGDEQKAKKGGLYRINPLTHAVELSLPFATVQDHATRLCLNPAKDTLYYLNKGVFRFGINQTAFSSTVFIGSAGGTLYGLGVDPQEGTLAVSDALDYVQKGMVRLYSPEGKLQKSFKAGIIPGDFYFPR